MLCINKSEKNLYLFQTDDLNGSDEDSEEDEIDDVEEENFNNKKVKMFVYCIWNQPMIFIFFSIKKLSGKSFSKSKPEKVGKKKSGTDEKDETGILDGVGNMMEDFKSSFTDKLPRAYMTILKLILR